MTTEDQTNETEIEEIWVSTREGSEITGYSQKYLGHLANSIWSQPEDERPIRLRYRSRRYEYWLPDLVKYSQKTGNGPLPKRT